jgi:predicted membrane-bound spermidine synthase
MYRHITVFLFAGLLAACSAATLNKDAAHVEIAADPFGLAQCKYLGAVVGSEGYWYNYLFIPNRTLMQGAVDGLRNQANALGGDTTFIREDREFTTSVTLLGLVYRCKK